MAILKYQKEDGTIGYINQYNVIPTPVVQEKGQSTVDVMSQKAVTDELNFLQQYFEGKFDDLVTCDCPDLSVDLLSYVKKSENTLARIGNSNGDIIPTLIIEEEGNGSDNVGIYTKEQLDQKFNDLEDIYAKQEWVIEQLENLETGENVDHSLYATKEELNSKPNVWCGSKEDYEGLGEYDNNTIYLIEL